MLSVLNPCYSVGMGKVIALTRLMAIDKGSDKKVVAVLLKPNFLHSHLRSHSSSSFFVYAFALRLYGIPNVRIPPNNAPSHLWCSSMSYTYTASESRY
eukprot:scaffold2181_cov164-Skeletonema_marinoi.AAC.1